MENKIYVVIGEYDDNEFTQFKIYFTTLDKEKAHSYKHKVNRLFPKLYEFYHQRMIENVNLAKTMDWRKWEKLTRPNNLKMFNFKYILRVEETILK